MGLGVLAAVAVLGNWSGLQIGTPRQIGEFDACVSIIEARFHSCAFGEAEVDVGHPPGVIAGKAVASAHGYGRVHANRIVASTIFSDRGLKGFSANRNTPLPYVLPTGEHDVSKAAGSALIPVFCRIV